MAKARGKNANSKERAEGGVKKVRVFFWMDARQKEKLTELSKKNRVLPSYYLKEAIDDLLKKYEQFEYEQSKEVEGNFKVKVSEG